MILGAQMADENHLSCVHYTIHVAILFYLLFYISFDMHQHDSILLAML